MVDPTAQNVGVGGMLFLSALWLLLKYKPWKNGNSKNSSKSGDVDKSVWEANIRTIVREENEDQMAHIRQLMSSRNEEIRRIIREEK